MDIPELKQDKNKNFPILSPLHIFLLFYFWSKWLKNKKEKDSQICR